MFAAGAMSGMVLRKAGYSGKVWAMDDNDERRAHLRVEVFPQWEQHDIHRVWMFHAENDPGAIYTLLLNYSRGGGCMLMHKQDELPTSFTLSLVDHSLKQITGAVVETEKRWEEPYFAGYKKVGFTCVPRDLEADEFLHRLETGLVLGEFRQLRCRILPA